MMNNELIRELAIQAGLKAEYGSDREGLADFDYRKFAELVIKECIDIADNYVREGDTSSTKKSLIGKEIVKHFGIE